MKNLNENQKGNLRALAVVVIVIALSFLFNRCEAQKSFDFAVDSIVFYHMDQNDYITSLADEGVEYRVIDGVIIYRLDEPGVRFFPTGEFEKDGEFLVTKGMDQDGDFVLLGLGQQDGITALIITYLGEEYENATFMLFGKIKNRQGGEPAPKKDVNLKNRAI